MLALLLALFGAPVPAGADWPQWRGPSFDGSCDERGLPDRFGPDENVVWRTTLPGQGAATPVVWGDRVFLTALESETEELIALGLERSTGRVLWERVCGEGRLPSGRSRGRENTFAACSPVTDGELVAFLFGSGDLVTFDVAGRELWRTDFVERWGELVINWGYAASPLLFEGRLIVPVLRRAESFVAAFDARSGELLWREVRPTDARAESQEAYTTPIPFRNGERVDVLVYGGDCLTGHDPETGAERWRFSGVNPRQAPNFRAVSSPVVGTDGMVFVTTPQHGPMHGLRVTGDEVEHVWELARPTPDSTTPLYYRDRLWSLDGRRGRLVCIEPTTGEIVWQAELETGTFLRASPLGADGKVFVMDAEGTVVVVRASDEYEELARVSFDSYPSRSSIIANRGRLLIRTAERLYCLGEEARDEE